jgi:hypothetical protein
MYAFFKNKLFQLAHLNKRSYTKSGGSNGKKEN